MHTHQLWLPILVSAVVVFLLSAVSHMFLPWRRAEWRTIPKQGEVQAALGDLPPGLYAFPRPSDPKEAMTRPWMDRWAAGPSGWLTLAPRGPIVMLRNLGQSFAVYLIVSAVVGYVAAHTLGPAAGRHAILRLVGTVGFLAYAGGAPFASIWYSRPWKSLWADLLDAVVFSLAMGASFAHLWPHFL